MKIKDTKIAGVHVIESLVLSDPRGSFSRWFCEKELAPILDNRHILQINHSTNHQKGAVRGLHFQKPPHAEMKLIRCIKGRVWDVALDLRKESETFLQWHAEELSAANNYLLVVPEGCAHGFQVLEEGSELLYLHTAFYEPACEGAIRYDDPRVNISWPLAINGLSGRDATHPHLNSDFKGV